MGLTALSIDPAPTRYLPHTTYALEVVVLQSIFFKTKVLIDYHAKAGENTTNDRPLQETPF